MCHLEEHQMLLENLQCFHVVGTSAEVPMYSCFTLAMRVSDTPYFDNTIEIACRSMEFLQWMMA